VLARLRRDGGKRSASPTSCWPAPRACSSTSASRRGSRAAAVLISRADRAAGLSAPGARLRPALIASVIALGPGGRVAYFTDLGTEARDLLAPGVASRPLPRRGLQVGPSHGRRLSRNGRRDRAFRQLFPDIFLRAGGRWSQLHDDYLEFLVEAGIPGAVLLLCWPGLAWRCAAPWGSEGPRAVCRDWDCFWAIALAPALVRGLQPPASRRRLLFVVAAALASSATIGSSAS